MEGKENQSNLTPEEIVIQVEEILKDEKNKKKYEEYKSKLEKLLGVEVYIDPVLGDEEELFGELNEGYTDNSQDQHLLAYNMMIRELLEARFDTQKREVFLTGEIVEDSVEYVDTRLRLLERIVSSEEEKTATIVVDTAGGDAYSMWGIIDLIRLSKMKVNTLGRGKIMSAGAFIVIAGKHRQMYRNSTMMIHDLRAGTGGAFKDMINDFNHMGKIQQKVYDFLASHSCKTKGWWEEKLQRDFYLSADEALELGLIDEIL